MNQDKAEIILWEIYNNARQLDDNDLEKAKAEFQQLEGKDASPEKLKAQQNLNRARARVQASKSEA